VVDETAKGKNGRRAKELVRQDRKEVHMATNYRVTEIFFNPQQGRGQAVIGNFSNIVSVAGFFTPDDNFRHAIVATQDGKVTEIFFNPQQGRGQAVIGNFNNIVSVGGFYSDDDKFRHAIVAAQA